MKLSREQWFYIILAGLAGALIVFAPLPVRVAPPSQRTFRVEASQFAYSPAVLTVNPGDIVTIELVSTDVVHGLYVDGYGASVTADPGQTVSLTFIANKPGSFRFRCNVTCGALHPFMIGKLQVGTNTLLWRAVGLALLAAFSGVALFPRPATVKAV
jgi:heme/copper-type cytochrome/quinol oxidase subunit 2